ncbi:MAG TPA: hypothetical protein VGJ33_15180 [Candidatus Angelobacter sp.]|jgi:hypothetical protein
MSFSISYRRVPLEYPYDDGHTAAARGEIVLGDFREGFLSNLGEWRQADYREQWRRSIHRLLAGEQKAVLITTFSSPTIATHLEWWALYREEDNVAVQNQLLFYDNIQGEFDVKCAVDFLNERRRVTEDGRPISEWSVSMNDLRVFASHLDKGMDY